MNTIFVYGTLKRGYGNNHILKSAAFLGSANSVSENYVMWGGGFPFLSECNQGNQVSGELYEVSDFVLARCDQLEGHPDWYRRSKRYFKTTDGKVVEAWVYLQPYNPKFREAFYNPREGFLKWPKE